jgi:hypothetical protein
LKASAQPLHDAGTTDRFAACWIPAHTVEITASGAVTFTTTKGDVVRIAPNGLITKEPGQSFQKAPR